MQFRPMVALKDHRLHDPKHQAALRESLRVNAPDLVREIVSTKFRVEGRAGAPACAQDVATQRLFHPQPEGDILDPFTNLRREPNRPARVAAARKVCVGDGTAPECPCWAECLAWRMRVGLGDKFCFAAGLTTRSVRHILAEMRREAGRTPSSPTELVPC